MPTCYQSTPRNNSTPGDGPVSPAVGGVVAHSEFRLPGSAAACVSVQPSFPHHSSSSFVTSQKNSSLSPLYPGDTQKALGGVPAAVVAPWEAGPSVRWASGFRCVLPMHLALRVVYLRSLFLIIIVHTFSFHAEQQESAGGGSKSSFNFHCDGLSLHLKRCLICTCAPRLLNIELI